RPQLTHHSTSSVHVYDPSTFPNRHTHKMVKGSDVLLILVRLVLPKTVIFEINRLAGCHPLPSRGRCFHHRLQLRPPYQHPPHDLRIHSWTHSCLLAHLQEDEGRGTLRTWWLPLRRERYLRAHQRWRSAAAVLWRNFQLKSRFLRS
ncbi:unnamed protein product, partial [Mycena citricolor]